MGFTDLLEEVGGLGRFQLIHITLLSIPGLLMACQNLLNNFTAGIPAHHCTIPNLTTTLNLSTSEEGQISLLRAFIPLAESQLSKCSRYVQPQWHLSHTNHSQAVSPNLTEVETESCKDGWTYKRTEFISTIVSEWDLVCSLRPLKQMSQTIYMGGVLTGAIIFGGLSDKFGRKLLLTWSYFQLAALGTFTAFSSSYLAYCTLRFLTGMAVSGVILNTVSLKVEWIPTKTRTLVGSLSSLFFTFGQMILAGIAYGLKDWRKLHVAVCSPFFIIFLYSWWFSESARWLVLNGRLAEALQQLHRVARINGKDEAMEKITLEVLQSHMQKEVQSSKTVFTVYDLLRTPVMRRISLCLIAVWFSTSFAYYGLAMDLQKFGVNIYLMQLIFGAVDFPAKLVALVMLSFLGRRLTQGTCLLTSASIIFINIFIPKDMQILRTVLAVLGKGFTSASFTCVYLFTGELYPTVIRSSTHLLRYQHHSECGALTVLQTGMGFASTMARIGSMAAPVVLFLDEVFPALPSVVYGAAAILAGLTAFLLPETLNVTLPDTIEDVEEKWSKKTHRFQEQVQSESMTLDTLGQPAEESEDRQSSGLDAL
ncbi:solute carrier family 22 member 6 isoform X1 [Hemibagrus wyckioides]|uniref:solute carrier family 22 member 6 isoform X1 n=1 Tax=Hemibagrus wyckioides TaxID=337641 RepID=UPI00266DB171|nr:solute carrier family 22 member 6 isoform X1 [Hemibagrus wyckioides]